MSIKRSYALFTLATLTLSTGCSPTSPPSIRPLPPADVMQPPEVVDFLTPMEGLLKCSASPPPPSGRPSN